MVRPSKRFATKPRGAWAPPIEEALPRQFATMYARQHYVSMAKYMQRTRHLFEGKDHLWQRMRDEMAAHFTSDNPNFKRERFIKACNAEINVHEAGDDDAKHATKV